LHEEKSEAEVLSNLASAAIGAKDWDRAQDYNRRALEIKSRRNDPDAELYSLVNEARIREGRGDVAGALETLGAAYRLPYVNPSARIEAEVESISVYRVLRDEPHARAHYQEAVNLSERVRSELLKNENKMAWFEKQKAVNEEWVEFLIETGRINKALETAEASRARLMNERLTADAGRTASSGTDAYRSLARARKAVIVSYWLTSDRSYAWVIKPDGIVLRELPGELRIEALVARYRGFLERGGDPLHSDEDSGKLLRQAVLGPLQADLAGARSIILVPDGPLHALNFETLPIDGHYWIDDVTVTVAPSLNILGAGAESRPPSQPSILAIGDAQPVPEFPRLPSAGREMDCVAALFPHRSTILRGAQATPSAYLHFSSVPAYIHFAAHASASAERPLESAVILSPVGGDGRLTARALLEKPVHAELVTISACRSAGVRAYHGEGLVGFAWVFLQTGSHGVIAGLWDASDDATASLMADLYKGITQGASPSAALRNAKLNLMRSSPRFAAPYYWAPFQYYAGKK
jgi:CHAT domain-containing protein